MSATQGRSCFPGRSRSAQAAAGQPCLLQSERGRHAGSRPSTEASHTLAASFPPSSAASQMKRPSNLQPTAPCANQTLPEEKGCLLTPRKSPEHCHLPLRPETSRRDLHFPSPFLPSHNDTSQAPWQGEAPWPHPGTDWGCSCLPRPAWPRPSGCLAHPAELRKPRLASLLVHFPVGPSLVTRVLPWLSRSLLMDAAAWEEV